MINETPLNESAINGVSLSQTGLTATAIVEITAVASPTPPILLPITDPRKILVFTVEIYPSFIPDRVLLSDAILSEGDDTLTSEAGDALAPDETGELDPSMIILPYSRGIEIGSEDGGTIISEDGRRVLVEGS